MTSGILLIVGWQRHKSWRRHSPNWQALACFYLMWHEQRSVLSSLGKRNFHFCRGNLFLCGRRWVCFQMILYYWPPLLGVLIVSISIGIYQTYRPSSWPNLARQEYLAPFELMSFVLSLLLVFRTNSAYGRQAPLPAWGSMDKSRHVSVMSYCDDKHLSCPEACQRHQEKHSPEASAVIDTQVVGGPHHVGYRHPAHT